MKPMKFTIILLRNPWQRRAKPMSSSFTFFPTSSSRYGLRLAFFNIYKDSILVQCITIVDLIPVFSTWCMIPWCACLRKGVVFLVGIDNEASCGCRQWSLKVLFLMEFEVLLSDFAISGGVVKILELSELCPVRKFDSL